jgi:hypothetical protein
MLRKARAVWCCAGVLAFLAGCCCCCCGKHSGCDPEERTGHPQEIAPWAVPSDTGKYIGYEVGGGAVCHGDGPTCHDGTWGWDYLGCCLPSKIILGWFHGRKYQDGIGSYEPDGPRVIEKIEQRNEHVEHCDHGDH